MKKKKIFSLLKFVFLVGVTIVMLFPIIYIIVNSFMSTNEIQLAYPEEGFAYLHLIPDKITLDQYYFSLFRSSEYAPWAPMDLPNLNFPEGTKFSLSLLFFWFFLLKPQWFPTTLYWISWG